MIHTFQLNFLSSDWLFSKSVECIDNVYCTPRTVPWLREMLLMHDCTRVRHIDWSIIFHWREKEWTSLWHFKAILFIIFKAISFIIFHEHERMILFFWRVWIRLINLHLLLLGKCNKSMHLPEFDSCPMHSALRAAGLGHWTHQNSVCMHWICFISLEKVNAHLLTSN